VVAVGAAGVPNKWLGGRLNISAESKYPIKPKARLMVVNALSECDAPGEYCV